MVLANPLLPTGVLRKALVLIHPLSDLSLPTLPALTRWAPNMREALETAQPGECLTVGRDTSKARQRVRTSLQRYKPPGTTFARFELERRDGTTDLWLIRIR